MMSKLGTAGVLAAAILGAALSAGAAQAADPLPSYTVDKTKTSVSGLSSGAFMAVQFHTAYSGSVMGSAIVAGGPYNCAYVNLGGTVACMSGAPLASSSYAAAKSYEALGEIDPLSNFNTAQVYLYTGLSDQVVANAVVDATRSYYQMIGVPDAKITYVNSVNSGHAFISPDNGVTQDCPVNASPYVNRCTLADGNRYDQAKALLTQIYGTLNPASASPQGQIVAFDQSKFNGIGMADTGYLYVPNACASGQTCKIHVAFHGCGQSAGDIGSLYYTETGYNPWSDTNNILVLYPQVSTTLPTNPDHCWDWFGYTGPNFNVKSSSQMSAIKAMIDRLAGQ